MNLFSSRILAYINAFSVFWHVAGVAVLIILLPAVAPTRQPASYVFGQFNVWQTLTNGITNNGCAWLPNLHLPSLVSCRQCIKQHCLSSILSIPQSTDHRRQEHTLLHSTASLSIMSSHSAPVQVFVPHRNAHVAVHHHR